MLVGPLGCRASNAGVPMSSRAVVPCTTALLRATAFPLTPHHPLQRHPAGCMALEKRTLTEDGFEMQLGTNHLGHFVLVRAWVCSVTAVLYFAPALHTARTPYAPFTSAPTSLVPSVKLCLVVPLYWQTNALVPALTAGAPSRVVNVSSMVRGSS